MLSASTPAQPPVLTDRLLSRGTFARVLQIFGHVAATVILIVTARIFIQSFIVTEASMAPTLLSGDVVLVTKLPSARRLVGLPPTVQPRFSVIATRSPLGPGIIVKRIAGVPGDTLGMASGHLAVNGVAIDEPWSQTAERPDLLVDWQMTWQREYLTAPHAHALYLPSRDRWGPLVVPDGHYFLLGDNRARSVDSRQNGFITHDDVIGTARFILWSTSSKNEPPSGGKGARWSRLLHHVR